MIIVPFAGAVLQAFLTEKIQPTGRWVALSASLISSIVGIFLVVMMQTQADLQSAETIPWIGSYAIHYEMGVDGLNAPLLILLSILFPILIACEWNRPVGGRGIHGLFLVLQSAFIGAVCAQDIFLQFFFWALSAFPFYFLVGIWGGKNRESAAFRSIVVSSLGNALFFAALILIYYSVDPHSFSIHELGGDRLAAKTFSFLGGEYSMPVVAFALIGVGLAFRAPIWPLHGWFTHVAEEAPLSVVVAVSAVTVPVAAYIFERLIYALFPDVLSHFAPVIVAVGAVNLVVGTLCAVAQRDLRLLLAYICLGQIGTVMLGIGSLSSAGFVGAIYEQLVLGLGIAGFGLFSNVIIARSGRSEFVSKEGQPLFGGIAIQAPAMAVVAGAVIASLLGFPGLGGFVGQAMVVLGGFPVHPIAVGVVGFATLVAAYYLFTMYRRVFLGSPSQDGPAFSDLTIWEKGYFIPLVASLLFFGLYPKPLIELVRPTAVTLLSTLK
jgi:NADH-quinone oxidoreductase subunit M